MPHHKITADEVDNLLPQTQCRDCEYNSCRLYAEAMANNNESINKCLPGGLSVLKKLGEFFEKDISPYVDDMREKAKLKQLAIIREAECIGCAKCIKACPVDAIVGSKKLMHTVIINECTGCDLCVARCPVDCIDIVSTEDQTYHPEHARNRYLARNKRLKNSEENVKRSEQNNFTKRIRRKKSRHRRSCCASKTQT